MLECWVPPASLTHNDTCPPQFSNSAPGVLVTFSVLLETFPPSRALQERPPWTPGDSRIHQDDWRAP
eukprot:7289155-Pyramimonas_sp.AAC.1